MNSLLLYLLGTLLRGAALWLLLIMLLERVFHLNLGRLGSRRLWWGMLLVMLLPLSIIFLPMPAPQPVPVAKPAPLPPVMETVPQPQFEAPVELPELPLEITAPAPQKQFQFPTPERLAGILAVVYIVIAGILLSYRVYQMIRWRHCLRGCAPVFEPRLLALFERARRMTGTEKLRVSLLDGGGCIDSPACGGIIKPYILFPVDDASKWCDGEISMLLIHELSHVRRRDYVWNSILYFAEAFYWFNPVFRVIRRRLSQAWETDCDSAVIKNLGLSADERGQYARLLMDFAIRAGVRRATPVLGAEGNVAELKLRIKEIMSNKKFMRRSIAVSVILLAGLAAGLLTPAFAEEKKPYIPPEIQSSEWKDYLDTTDQLIENKQYQEAYDRCLWLLNNAPQDPNYRYTIGTPKIAQQLQTLGKVYLPAANALKDARDEKVRQFRSGQINPDEMYTVTPPANAPEGSVAKSYANVASFGLVVEANRLLEEPDSTYELFAFLEDKSPNFARSCWVYLDRDAIDRGKTELVKKYSPELIEQFTEIKTKLNNRLFTDTWIKDTEKSVGHSLDQDQIAGVRFSFFYAYSQNAEYLAKAARLTGQPELAKQIEEEMKEITEKYEAAKKAPKNPEQKPEPVKNEKVKTPDPAAETELELRRKMIKDLVEVRALVQNKQYEDALKGYQQLCSFEGWWKKRIFQSMFSRPMQDLYEWGQSYQPAMDAFNTLRDYPENYIRSHQGGDTGPDLSRDWNANPPVTIQDFENRAGYKAAAWSYFGLIQAIDHATGQQQRTMELFRYLDKTRPAEAGQYIYAILDYLFETEELDLIRKYYYLESYMFYFPELYDPSDANERNMAKKYIKQARMLGKNQLADDFEKAIAKKEAASKEPGTVKQEKPAEPVLSELKEIKKLVQEQKYAEALKQYQQFCSYDKTLQPSLHSTFYKVAVQDWYQLGLVYPPAMNALIAERDYQENYIRSAPGNPEPDNSRDWNANPPKSRQEAEKRYGHNYVSWYYFAWTYFINKAMDKQDQTVELFRYLDTHHPSTASLCVEFLLDYLIETKEVELVKKHSAWLEGRVTSFLKTYDPSNAGQQKTREQYIKQARLIGKPELAERLEKAGVPTPLPEKKAEPVKNEQEKPKPAIGSEPTADEFRSWPNYEKTTKALVKEKKYAEALKRYQLFFEHDSPSSSHAVYGWYDLGLNYPPAMDALIKTRDDKVAFLKSGKALSQIPGSARPPRNLHDSSLISDITTINRKLDQNEETVELFKYFDRSDPKLVRAGWYYTMDSLLEAREYDLIRKYDTNLEREFDTFFKTLDTQLDVIRKYGHMNAYINYANRAIPKYQKRAEIQGKYELAEHIGKVTRAKIAELTGTEVKEVPSTTAKLIDNERGKYE